VIDIGRAATPLTYFAPIGCGPASVTGSHNPPDYSGFKIVLGGDPVRRDPGCSGESPKTPERGRVDCR
jgi:phosphomannomutase